MPTRGSDWRAAGDEGHQERRWLEQQPRSARNTRSYAARGCDCDADLIVGDKDDSALCLGDSAEGGNVMIKVYAAFDNKGCLSMMMRFRAES
jgi:hypothetical protein